MATKLQELSQRIEKLEKSNNQEILTLVEILSNLTFFGELKRANCEYANNEQCGLFVVDLKAKNKIPILTECRIDGCKEQSLHGHIELSNITCSLCQRIFMQKDLSLRSISQKTNVENVTDQSGKK